VGRKANKDRPYKIRVKMNGHFRSTRLFSKNTRSAASRVKGRILSVSKISPEEIGRYGEFFTLGDKLMREFREIERSKKEVIGDRREKRPYSPGIKEGSGKQGDY
jgi:hypothetical protein